MTTYTGAAFNRGPILRLLDLCIAANAPGGPPLEDELTRFCRSIEDSGPAQWLMPAAGVAGLLDLVSEQIQQREHHELPVGFLNKLAEASSGAASGPAYLQALAKAIRDIDQKALPDFETLPLSSWEIRMRFNRIRQFGWWLDSGDFDDYEQGLQQGIESEHPSRCHQELPFLAAELQQALLIFSSKEQFASSLAAELPWASQDTFREILNLIHTHFAEQH